MGKKVTVTKGVPEKKDPKNLTPQEVQFKYYEGKVLNDPRYLEADEVKKKEYLSNFFDNYKAPALAEEGITDPMDLHTKKTEYINSTFKPPTPEIIPQAEEPVPSRSEKKTEPPHKRPHYTDYIDDIIPEGKTEGLLTSIPEGEPLDQDPYMQDLLERLGSGVARLPEASKQGSKFAERILEDVPGGIIQKELELIGVDKGKAEKISEKVTDFLWAGVKPVQILKAANKTKDIINEETNYYDNWEEIDQRLQDRSKRYDKTITELWKGGEKGKAVSSALLFGAESLPQSMLAAFGGAPGLATLGLMAGGAKDEELLDMGIAEDTALVNAMITGTVEAVTELGTASLGGLMKKMYSTIGKEATEQAVKAGLRGWLAATYSKVGLWTAPIQEGSEEAVNRIAENLTDKFTGVDPDRDIRDGVFDNFMAGAGGGAYFMGGGMAMQAAKKIAKPKMDRPSPLKPEEPPVDEPPAEQPPADEPPPKPIATGLRPAPEYVEKVRAERAFFDDKRIKEEQEEFNLPDTPDLNIGNETDETLDAIDKGEPVMNDRLKMAADNLYEEYKKLAAMQTDPKRKYTTEQIDDMMAVLEFEITLLNDRINEQAGAGEFKTEPVKLTDKIEVSEITEEEPGETDEGVQPEPEVVEPEPEPEPDIAPFMDQYQLQERIEVADRAIKAIEKMKKAGETGFVQNKEDNFASMKSMGLFGRGRNKIEGPGDYDKLFWQAMSLKQQAELELRGREKMEPVKEGMIRYGSRDYASVEELAAELAKYPIEKLPQPDLDLNVYKAMDMAQLIRDGKKPPEDPPAPPAAAGAVVEEVIEETPPAEPIQFLGEPNTLTRLKAKEFAQRLTNRQNEDNQAIAPLRNKVADLNARLNNEFKGQLNLTKRKERKAVQDEITTTLGQITAIDDTFNKDLDDYLQEARPEMENVIRTLKPTVEDTELQGILDRAWVKMTEPTAAQQEMTVEDVIIDEMTEAPVVETKPEPTPQIVTEEQKINRQNLLLERVKQYNDIPANQNKKRAELYQAIQKSLAEFGYKPSLKGKTLVILDDAGKKVRAMASKTPKEIVEAHKTLEEYEDEGFVELVTSLIEDPTYLKGYDVGLSIEQIASAVKNIKAGKRTVASNRLLDALEASYGTGVLNFKPTQFSPSFDITVPEFLETVKDQRLEDFTKQYGDLSPDNIDQAVAAGLITEDEKNFYLKQLEDEIRIQEEAERPVTTSEEERADVDETEGTGQVPEVDIKADLKKMTDLLGDLDFDQGMEMAQGDEGGLDARTKMINTATAVIKKMTGAGIYDFDQMLTKIVPALDVQKIKKLLPFFKQGYAAHWATAAEDVKNQMSINRAGTFDESDLDALIGDMNAPDELDNFDDLVNKDWYIPKHGVEIKVLRIEKWKDPKDQKVNMMEGGMFKALPDEFQPVDVAIVKNVSDLMGGKIVAVTVDQLRATIKSGQITEVVPYDVPEFTEAMEKAAQAYLAMGDTDSANKLRKKATRDPGDWKAQVVNVNRRLEMDRKNYDILIGKTLYPSIKPEGYDEQTMWDFIDGTVKRGEPLSPYIRANVPQETIDKVMDLARKHHEILAQLGFNNKSMKDAYILNKNFMPGSPIASLMPTGRQARMLANNHPQASKEKLADALKSLDRSIKDDADNHRRVRERALAWDIKNRIWKGEKIQDFPALMRIAKEWGVTDRTAVREQAELAMVGVARAITRDLTMSPYDQFVRIQELYSTFPTLTHRTNEIKEKQQYSTPVPIAHLMSEYVNAKQASQVMDPSAGNGSLLIGAEKGAVRANDIDARRFHNLMEQGYRVYQEDSTHGIARMLDVQSVPAILINPPFGGPKEDYNGYPLTGEYVPVAHALESLSDDGKAGIIVGGHIEFKENGQMKGKDLYFFNWLNKYFNVEDVVQVPGEFYRKMGAQYPVKIILVNGRKAAPSGAAPLHNESFNPVESWTELRDRILMNQSKPNEKNTLQPKVDANRGDDTVVGDTGTPIDPDPNPKRDDTVSPREDQGPVDEGGPREGVQPIADEVGPDPGTGRRRADQTDNGQPGIPKPAQSIVPEDGGRGSRSFGEVQPKRDPGDLPVNNIGKPDQRTQRELSKRTGDEVTPYRPLSKLGSGNYIVPASIALEVEDALAQLKDEIGDIDQFVMDKLGYNSKEDLKSAFFAEQVDGIAQSIYNIENNNAMIIGHQTGTGKGRIAAGIIRYAIKQGKLPVFITKSADLFSDMYRDLINIGSPTYQPFMMNRQFPDGQKTKVFHPKTGEVLHEVDVMQNQRIIGKGQNNGTQKLPDGTEVIMTTYSQFTTEGRDDAKRDFLRSLAQRGDVVFVMDESHEASGMSNTGQFFMDWIQMTQGGAFLSATYAKRPDNMPLYAMKTVLRETNMDLEDMVEAIKSGGPALQEIITLQLAESGQFSKIGFKMDAEMNYLIIGDDDTSQPTYNPELGDEMVRKFDGVTNILQQVIDFQRDFVNPVLKGMDNEIKKEGQGVTVRQGTTQAGISNSPYFSRVWSIIDQLILSSKVKESIPLIVKDLQRGVKPVIALKSTMEAMFKDMVENGELAKGETIPLDFSHVLKKGMGTVMKYTEKDDMGNPLHLNLSPENLSPMGRQKYYSLLENIQDLSTGIPISPIDILRKGITEAGFDFVEITGRGTMFEMNEDMTNGTFVNNDRGAKIDAVRKFNNNPGVAAIINRAGSTGISMHSSPDFADKNQRSMYILQNDLDINVVVQILGRIYRADQLNKPIYNILTSRLPAELRMFMMNARKLKSLDANTSGNQKQSKNLVEVEDFLNKYGDEVVAEYLKENPVINNMIGDPLDIGSGDDAKKANAAHRVTGRIQILPSYMQEEFNREIIERYQDAIEYLNSTGTNDLMVTTEDLKATIQEKNTVIEGQDNAFSTFGDATVLNKAEVDVTRRPYTKKQLDEKLDEVPTGHSIDIQNEMEKGIEQRVTDQVAKIQAENEDAKKFHKQKIEDRSLSAEEKVREYDIKVRELDEREAVRLEGIRNSAEENKQTFIDLINDFPVGRVVEVPFTGGDQLDLVRMNKGVFLGFDVNMNKANPWVPSNFMLKFATSDSRIMIKIPASKGVHIKAIRDNSYHISRPQANEILEDWDNVKKGRDRETRYIVTQNVLQGMNVYKNGRLVQFTKDDGTSDKGILMSENWIRPDDRIARIPVTKGINIIKALAPMDFVEDFSGDILIKKLNFNTPQMYELRVPSSTKKGKRYYSNEDVKRIVQYGLFEQHGKDMVAKFSENNLEELLEVLSERFKTVLEVDSKHVQKAHDTTESGEMMMESAAGPRKAKSRNIENPYNDVIGATEKNFGNRVQADPLTGFEPKRLGEIQMDLGAGIGTKIIQARRPSTRGKAIGAYNTGAGTVKIKFEGDLNTTAHEIGHEMDDRFGLLGPEAQGVWNQLKSELENLWEYGSDPPDGHPNPDVYRMHEGMAEFIRAWTVNPAEAKRRFPFTYSWFKERVGQNQETWDALSEFSRDIRKWWGSTAREQVGSKIFMGPPQETPKFVFRRENDKGQFQLTYADRFAAKYVNFFRPLEQAYRWAMGKKGIDIDNLEQLSPLENFNILARLLLGNDVKMRNAMEHGVVDFNGNRIFDPKTKQPLSFHLMLSQVPNHTWKDIEANLKEAVDVGMSERVKEIPWKIAARQIRSDIAAGYLPPDNVLRQHPWTEEKFSDKINAILDKIMKGEINEEDVRLPESRYDFTDMVINGIAQEGMRDFDVAVKAVEDFKKLERTDPVKHEWISEFNRIYREIAKNTMVYARDAGLISEETFEQIDNENLSYMAMRRLFAMDPADIASGKAAESINPTGTTRDGRGLVKVVIHPIKGSQKDIRNPVEALIESYHKVVQNGDLNYTITQFAKAFTPSRNWYEGTPVKIGEVAWVSKNPEKNNIPFFINGKQSYLNIPDPEIHQLMKELIPATGTSSKIVQGLRWLPQKLRGSIIAAPIFAARNIVRDFQHFLVVGTGLRYMRPKDLIPNKKMRDEFETSGAGQFGYLVSSKRGYYELQKMAMYKISKDPKKIIYATDMASKRAYENIFGFMMKGERLTRMMQFKASIREGMKKHGLSEQEAVMRAAYHSRDLMDFMVGGTTVKELNQVIIFLNPAIRGLDKIARSMKDPKQRASVIARMGLVLAVPGVLNSLMIAAFADDKEKEEYLNAPAYERDMFYRIPRGNGWVMIPRPFELAVITSIFQRLTDMIVLGDENAFSKEFYKSIAHLISPTDVAGLVGGFSGVVGALFNYDFFRQKHIIPPEDVDISIASRNTDYASQFGQAVQQASHIFTKEKNHYLVDARKVDAFLQGQFSYYGNFFLKATELMIPGKGQEKYKFGPTSTGFFKYANAYGEPNTQWVASQFKEHEKWLKAFPEYTEFSFLLRAYFSEESMRDKKKRREIGAALREYSSSLREQWKDVDFYEVDKAKKQIQQARRSTN